MSNSVRSHRRQPPGSPVPGILQARTPEWVAISFSNAWKWKVKVKPLGCVQPLATPWTAAYQAPPSMGFSRQEYWSGVPLPSPVVLLGQMKRKQTCLQRMVVSILELWSERKPIDWTRVKASHWQIPWDKNNSAITTTLSSNLYLKIDLQITYLERLLGKSYLSVGSNSYLTWNLCRKGNRHCSYYLKIC